MNKIQGVKEWAEASYNIQSGCKFNCAYCYAKAHAIRFKRHTAESWEKPIPKENITVPKNKTVMFPTTHDIRRINIQRFQFNLYRLIEAKNKIIIVSKPSYNCIVSICNSFKDFKHNILFRFTIGSLQDDILSFWEPRAPEASERIACLQYAFINGFKTSVSMEPLLNIDFDQTVNDILHLEQLVNEKIWIGKMNQGASRLTINGHSDKIKDFRKLDSYWNQEMLKKLQKQPDISDLGNKIAWKENCIKKP